ncbi:hypothetical protein F4T82_01110 [Acinetobacter lwoffii]|uniref:hypothetical protein n=1 Tax=Acinetobacter lwoffii TaxID=28090 RepID=UPI001298863A|nr:hypothetical protein [Acinetobacter lwoffii]MRA02386.1 hypothetical protein [Acinetobacter lwoffii]
MKIKIESLYIVFFVLILVVPFSTIFGVNFKLIWLLILFLSLIQFRDVSVSIFHKLIYFFSFLFFLCFYSVLMGNSELVFILKQAFDILTFYIVFLIVTSYAIYRNKVNLMLKLITYLMAVAALVKIIVMFLAYKKNILMSDFIEEYSLNYLTLDMEYSFIQRLTSQSDAIIPVALLFLLQNGSRNGFKLLDYVVFLFLISSVIFSMSRYIWFATVFSLVIYILMSRKVINFLYLSLFLFLSLLIYLTGIFSDIFEIRSDQKTNSASDSIRYLQQQGIYEQIYNNPFLGKGLGYYIPNIIRSDNTKYLYELQIPALIMQIGFVGFLFYLLFLFYPLLLSLKNVSKFNAILFIMVFIVWLGNSFFNPYLFSSPGGIAFSMILMLINSDLFKVHYEKN